MASQEFSFISTSNSETINSACSALKIKVELLTGKAGPFTGLNLKAVFLKLFMHHVRSLRSTTLRRRKIRHRYAVNSLKIGRSQFTAARDQIDVFVRFSEDAFYLTFCMLAYFATEPSYIGVIEIIKL